MEATTQAQAADVVATATAPVAEVTAPVTETPVATQAPQATPVEATDSTDEMSPEDVAKYEAKLRKALTEVKNLRGTKSALATEIEALRKEAEAAKAAATAGDDAKTQLQLAQEALKATRLELALGKSATRISDPALAVKLLDQSKVVWGEDGSVDVTAAIESLIEAHPVLAATPSKPTALGMISAPVRSSDPKSIDELEGLKGQELLTALNRLAGGR